MTTRRIDTKSQVVLQRQSDKLMDSKHGSLDKRLTRYMFRLKKQYLPLHEVPAIHKLNYVDRARLELTKQMVKLESDGRYLFHISITYRPYQERIYQETDVNTFFNNFYKQGFLPYLLDTQDIGRKELLEFHPVTFCFVDEHEHKAIPTKFLRGKWTQYEFPTRLHHHAVAAVHQEAAIKMFALHGQGTVHSLPMTNKVATSQVTFVRPSAVLYASKYMWKYPDYTHFGPQEYAPHEQEFVPNPEWDNFQSAPMHSHRYRYA
jgi:hypothetical protein